MLTAVSLCRSVTVLLCCNGWLPCSTYVCFCYGTFSRVRSLPFLKNSLCSLLLRRILRRRGDLYVEFKMFALFNFTFFQKKKLQKCMRVMYCRLVVLLYKCAFLNPAQVVYSSSGSKIAKTNLRATVPGAFAAHRSTSSFPNGLLVA